MPGRDGTPEPDRAKGTGTEAGATEKASAKENAEPAVT